MREPVAMHGMQEVRLVLARVDALVAVPGHRHQLDARIVTGGESVCAQTQRVLQAVAELDLAVAQHIGIGRQARAIGSEEAGEDTLPVFLRQIHAVQRNAKLLCDPAGVLEIFGSGAVSLLVLLPVVHEQALHLVTGAQQQQRRDCRVDAARQPDDDAPLHQMLGATACTAM